MQHKTLIFSILVILFTSIVTGQDKISGIAIDNPEWTKTEIKTYAPGTLYNAINGGAELYLKYEFKQMSKFEYQNGENYISVEIYEHGTPVDAFGVYSREKPSKDIYHNIGIQGFGENGYLFFVSGKYYIKIRASEVSNNSEQMVSEIAYQLVNKINDPTPYPAIFEHFPEDNRIKHSERYYRESILGYDFLSNSFEVSYNTDNAEYILFILKAENENSASEMLNQYLQFLNLPTKSNEGDLYSLDDRYNGIINILKSGELLICSRGNISPKESHEIFERINKSLNN